MNVKKGDYGYFKSEKKRRALLTILLFLLPLAVFIGGWLYFKSRTNLLTVIAVVGCLPACKSTVGLAMVLMQKSLQPEVYQAVAEAGQGLTLAYELYITTYEKSGYVDAIAICGNEVVGYTSRGKSDAAYIGGYIQKILRQNGFGVNVKIMGDFRAYLERLRSLREHRKSLEKDISFTPDERYPGLSRSELIKHTILAIAL